MTDTPLPDFAAEQLNELGLELPDGAAARLDHYLTLLLEANQRVNLTGIRDRDSAWKRHLIDSLSAVWALEELAPDDTLIDIGTGGGLPGIPIAIARPDLRVTLLEATGKKADCLRRFVAELGLDNVSIVNARAEEAGRDDAHRQHYDVAICRAVGPMAELLEYCLPLVRVGGFVLAIKGPKVEDELKTAGDAIDLLGGGTLQAVDAYPESFGLDSVLISVHKDRPTPKAYPRVPGKPRHDPL